jgi:disulfide bond formation protein DsbB
MPKKNAVKNLLIMLALASAAALIFVYAAQYIFNYQPCILCFYQRKPFFAVLALALISLTFFKSQKSLKISFFLCVIFLLINCCISFYHVGIEKKIFKGPATCSLQIPDNFDNLKDLKNALIEAQKVRCDEPALIFLQLSMAMWNFIYCLFLVLLSLIIFFQSLRHRKGLANPA